MVIPYVKHRRLLLRNHSEFNEKWLQQQIVEDALLGLVISSSRISSAVSRGWVASTCFSSTRRQTRYEVEIQLGTTDESHIIRTIEYWDIERRRYPQYDHVAVIVAEEITAASST